MKLTAIRLDGELLERVDKQASKLKRDRSSVIRELIERGLDTIEDKPLSDHDWVSRLEFNELLKRVELLEQCPPAKTAIATSPKINKVKDSNLNKEEALLNEIHANGWLTSEELCQRLKRSFGDISRKSNQMNKEEFAEFSKALDPSNVAWEKRQGKIGKFAVYMPINEPTNTDDTSENAL